MARDIGKIVCGFTFVVLFIPGLLFTISLIRLLDSGYYKSAAEASGFYAAMTGILLEEVSNQVEVANQNSNSGSTKADKLTKQIITQVVPVLLDESIVRDIFDRNVEGFVDYINGSSQQMLVYIPKKNVQDRINQALRILFDDIFPEANLNLPTCTESQLKLLYQSKQGEKIQCVPKFVKDGEVDFDEISTKFKSQVNDNLRFLLTGDDYVSIADVLSSSDRPGQSRDVLQKIETARTAAQMLQTVMIMFWVITGGLIVTYFGLARGSFLERLKSTLWPVGISGLWIMLLGGFVLLGVNALAILGGARQPELARLFQSLANGIFLPYFLIGTIMWLLSLGTGLGLKSYTSKS